MEMQMELHIHTESGEILPPRRRRIGNPKTRTGCVTCKSRRLKCDERKPFCSRCEIFGIQCAGYTAFRSQRPPSRMILPVRKGKTSPQLALYRPWTVVPGETAQENRYLSYFCEETASRFSGPWRDSLWSRLMLQACQNYDFTRHGLVALGAMNKSLEGEQLISQSRSQSSSSASSTPPYQDRNFHSDNSHRSFALLEYHKALRAMREAPLEESPAHNVRRALISSLLIIYFEKYLRNNGAVVRQMATAQSLLESFLLLNPLPPSFPTTATTGPRASPLPSTVEDELVAMYTRLDLQVMLFQDPRPRTSHEFRASYSEKLAKEMPAVFTTIHEARHMWDLLLSRICHFMIGAGQDPDATPLSSPSARPDLDGPLWQTLTALYVYGSPVLYTARAKANAVMHLREIGAWLAAVEPLFLSRYYGSDAEVRLMTFQIRVNAMFWEVIVKGMLFDQEESFDTLMPIFKSSMAFTEGALGGTGNVLGVLKELNKRGYSIDLGGAMPPFFMAMKCRERKTREQFMWIMEWMGSNWSGGAMDAKPFLTRIYSRVLKWIKDIEEEGLGPDDFIPERRRATLTRFAQHWEKPLVMAQCLLRCGGEDGGPVWFEETFEIEQVEGVCYNRT